MEEIERAGGRRSRDLEDILDRPAQHQEDHHHRAGGRARKSTAEPRRTVHRLRRTRSRSTRRRTHADDYPCHVFLSREGYFKKITPAVAAHERRSRSYKEGDALAQSFETDQRAPRCCSSPTGARSTRSPPVGLRRHQGVACSATICPAKLGMDEGESVVYHGAARRLPRLDALLL